MPPSTSPQLHPKVSQLRPRVPLTARGSLTLLTHEALRPRQMLRLAGTDKQRRLCPSATLIQYNMEKSADSSHTRAGSSELWLLCCAVQSEAGTVTLSNGLMACGDQL